MKFAITIILQLTFWVCVQAQASKSSAKENKPSISKKYFDCNDPYFLEDFINDQEHVNKKKLFDSLVKKSDTYKIVETDSISYYIDTLQYLLCKDTNQVCFNNNGNIKNNRKKNPKSSYIVWINKKAFYHVGFNAQNTKEFVDEFIQFDKIKSIAIVTPKQVDFCLGKTKAHIYITTKKKAKLNFNVAGFEKKQMKIGSRWVGHN